MHKLILHKNKQNVALSTRDGVCKKASSVNSIVIFISSNTYHRPGYVGANQYSGPGFLII